MNKNNNGQSKSHPASQREAYFQRMINRLVLPHYNNGEQFFQGRSTPKEVCDDIFKRASETTRTNLTKFDNQIEEFRDKLVELKTF